MTAQAVYFLGNGSIEVRNESVLCRDGDVTISSQVIGISHGSERRVLQGELPARAGGETIEALREATGYPVKYGYMNAGLSSDGERIFAFYPHQSRFCCSAKDVIHLPDSLSLEDAALLPSVETALSVVHDIHPRYGETVLLAGQGVVGLLVSELLVRSGARVIASDPVSTRRARAAALGCDTIDPQEPGFSERVAAQTDGRGCDVCVNLSGADDALDALIDVTAFGGRIVEASWYGSRRVPVSLGDAFHRQRLQIVSSQVSHVSDEIARRWTKARRFSVVLDLAESLAPSKYITHRFPLEDAANAFSLLSNPDDTTLQIILLPEESNYV